MPERAIEGSIDVNSLKNQALDSLIFIKDALFSELPEIGKRTHPLDKAILNAKIVEILTSSPQIHALLEKTDSKLYIGPLIVSSESTVIRRDWLENVFGVSLPAAEEVPPTAKNLVRFQSESGGYRAVYNLAKLTPERIFKKLHKKIRRI